ncbi:hypothetical protein [Saccharopolyspora sp. NPDC050642]|uniref:hypothetical protein n=1 Tax=Saccharopolyspora sp. NPDC050642 TaxID=3157099 RepID=UPI00340E1F6A
MRILRSVLRHFADLPRGYAADGRMLGLATSAAIDSSRADRQRSGGARSEPVARER